ncbi:MAG: hypothetical protein VB070_06770 [Clostridiaceae bacterium]|nr:hypothetical protein [Clostridiaceae bacterium]
MKAKRLITMSLAVLMALSLTVGCQAANGTESSGTAAGTSAAVGTETKSAVPAGEPVKISMGSTWQFQTTPCNWYETDVWKEILKRANVTIDSYVYYDQDKYNILLSGNDLPDLIFAYYPNQITNIVEGGLALDLKPYLSTYTNIDSDIFKKRNEAISKYYGGADNALYFLSDCCGVELRDGGTQSLRGYSVRWDYYKEIGAPEIKDSDTYIAAMEKMVAAHPTTPDGKKVYATGVAGSGFSSWYFNGCFCKPALMQPYTFMGYLYMEGFNDSLLYNAYTNTERSCYWSDMKFYNTLYNKGLLDPDSFTMTDEQRKAKSAAGQYVAEMGWANEDLYTAQKAIDPNTVAGMIDIPSEANIVYGNYQEPLGYFPAYQIWVSAQTKAADGVLSLLNVLHDPDVNRMMKSGVEGKQWNVVNGVPTLTDEAIALYSEAGDAWKQVGVERDSPLSFLQGSFLADDGYPLDLFDTDEMRAKSLNPLQKDYADFYKVDYPAQACMKLVKAGKINDLSDYIELVGFLETTPTDMERILTQCNDILFQAVPKLVQAKTDGEFAQIQAQVLADLKAAGEDTTWEWAQKNFENAKAAVK